MKTPPRCAPMRPFALVLLLSSLLALPLCAQPSSDIELQKLTEKAQALYRERNYKEAAPLLKQVLVLREQTLGPEHPDLAKPLNSLGLIYTRQAEYKQAEPYLQRGLRICENAKHACAADLANNLGNLYADQAKYKLAEPLYQKVLVLRKQALGPEHPKVADSINNLAILAQEQGKMFLAQELYQQSLRLREKILSKDNPDIAQSLGNLCFFYNQQSDYRSALPACQRSLEIREAKLGSEHPITLDTLNNLAITYAEQGNLVQAELLQNRIFQLRKKILGAEHPQVGQSLINLSQLYFKRKDYLQAEQFAQQASTLIEKNLGTEHPLFTTALNNLGVAYDNTGKSSQGLLVLQRALQIKEKLLGKQHPDLASTLLNLGEIYLNLGQDTKAEESYRRALKLWQDSGSLSRYQADILLRLAQLYLRQLKPGAWPLLKESTNLEESILRTNTMLGSEVQKAEYLQSFEKYGDAVISMHLRSAPTQRTAAQLALTTIFRHKGRTLDAQRDTMGLLRQRLQPVDQEVLEQWANIRSQWSTLTFQGAGDTPVDQYRTKLTALRDEAEQLETQLSRRSSEFQQEQQAITLSGIQRKLPKDSALLEFVIYRPFDLRAKSAVKEFGLPRYAVYLLQPTGEPIGIDLGPTSELDPLLQSWRKMLRDSRTPQALIRTTARQLDQKLLAPLRTAWGKNKPRLLLLAPDGLLNLLPLGALVDTQGQFLLQNHTLTYLSSGRDLLRLNTSSPATGRAEIFANPDFDQATDSTGLATQRSATSEDLTRVAFGPLPGTAQEATALASLLAGVEVRTGIQASEDALKALKNPRLLHLATHGFFLKATENTAENPLLRSGLALAGFNPRQSGQNDGVLTALEVAGLDLRGTQLVTLSACETGIGEVRNGEGVYGLRRAFVLAGAQTQVISLWQVSDEGTKDLMIQFYRNLRTRQGRAASLRQAQLTLLQQPQYQHPYYWAAFIPSGDWRPLPVN